MHNPDQNQQLLGLEPFRQVNKTFPHTDQILQLKQTGKKVFGWLCTYVPEEIIHAAGILPIRITGYSKEVDLDDGSAFMYINNCSFSRSCLQMGLNGQYDFLDGIVAGSTCDGARRLFDLWLHYLKPDFGTILTVPRKNTDRAHALYFEQVSALKKELEEFTGCPISDEKLKESIETYNTSRHLLKKLYDLRKLEKPPISGSEVMEVLNASIHMPKELFNTALQNLLDELGASGRIKQGSFRIMVIGSVMNNPEFVYSIEKLGGLVVTDELCTSTRYFSDPVVLDGQQPLKSISRRYLNNFPCARMVPSNDRFDRIRALVKEYRVDGVISQIIRYCVPYAHDLPLLKSRLEKLDVPVLSLDVEYGTSGSGQISTRVQAFLEMLAAKKK